VSSNASTGKARDAERSPIEARLAAKTCEERRENHTMKHIRLMSMPSPAETPVYEWGAKWVRFWELFTFSMDVAVTAMAAFMRKM
jgi:hypothetical protein